MIKKILMDIEGTTTSIDYVHQKLFPFAKDHMQKFILNNLHNPEVIRILQDARDEAEMPTNSSPGEVIKTFLEWMKADRKITPLKQIQGLIWQEGYKNGELQSHVYLDVVPHLKEWSTQLQIGIYSSGSIAAQKLLFSHTEHGNLSSLLSFHFDTTSGHKQETQSYTHIAKDLGVEPQFILFLSDIAEELDAAKAAGYHTTQLVRAQDKTVPNQTGHAIAKDFTEVSGHLKLLI
ncbi:MAG: acireductone synthase [Oligoflexales bacterium]